LRPGKPRSIDDERIAELLNTTLHARPKDGPKVGSFSC
jgi:putative transposase